MSDREKYERLGLHNPVTDFGLADAFTDLFDDKNIDVATGELLGRFISEERESARLHKRFYDTYLKKSKLLSRKGTGRGPGATTELKLKARSARQRAWIARRIAGLAGATGGEDQVVEARREV